MKHMKLTKIALASAFALFGTFALAATVRHRPSILHKRQSGYPNPKYGNPDRPTTVSAGGYLWNGRSASEWGGD